MRKLAFIIIVIILFRKGFAQTGFPMDSLIKYDSIKLVAMGIGRSDEGNAKFKEAEDVLERTFAANKKLTLNIRYSTLFNVMDDSKASFYVTFMENGKLIILWFRKPNKETDPDFVSSTELISQMEKSKENDLLQLEMEIKPAGSGKVNAAVPKRTTYTYNEDSKFYLHAKLLRVEKK